jgi:hypothetical protein
LKGDWAKCTLADGYRGWLPLRSISLDKPCVPTHIIVKRFARVSSPGDTDLLIPMGSLVNVVGRPESSYLLELPGGGHGRISREGVRRLTTLPWSPGRFRPLIREVAGTPYLWGGKSTFGFDCSGLVQFAFGFFGIDLPRDSGDQAKAGRAVRDLAGLGEYDLVFFGARRRIDHVAVHLGNLRILHASGCVRIESLKQGSRRFRSDLLTSLISMRRVWHV